VVSAPKNYLVVFYYFNTNSLFLRDLSKRLRDNKATCNVSRLYHSTVFWSTHTIRYIYAFINHVLFQLSYYCPPTVYSALLIPKQNPKWVQSGTCLSLLPLAILFHVFKIELSSGSSISYFCIFYVFNVYLHHIIIKLYYIQLQNHYIM